jgi:hypothetical protein
MNCSCAFHAGATTPASMLMETMKDPQKMKGIATTPAFNSIKKPQVQAVKFFKSGEVWHGLHPSPVACHK